MAYNSLITSTVIVLVLSNLGNFLQYLSQLVLGRALGPEAFGIFNSISALTVLVSSMTISFSFATAHGLIALGHDHAVHVRFVQELVKKTCYACMFLAVILVLCSRSIATYLSLDTVFPVFISIIIIWGIITQSLFIGVLQGLSRYTMLSLSQTIQTAARLLLIVIGVVSLNVSYSGALVCVLLSYIIVTVYYLYYLSEYILVPAPEVLLPQGLFRKMLNGSVHMTFMWLYIGIMSNMDIPLVKHYSSEYEAGLYSAGAIVGRIVWFLPAILVYVLFPEVLKSNSEGKSSVHKALLIAAITFIISFGLATVFYCFPEWFLTLLLGGSYVEAKTILIVVSFSMAILAMLCVLYNFCLAKKYNAFLYPAYLILGVCIILIAYYFHSSPIEIAYVFLAGLVVTAIVNIGQFVLKFRSDIVLHFG
jgi:O-antigen/teichoic acid export membrane protein